MKNLKKLRRNDLKKIDGGKRYPGNGGGAGCTDMCSSDSDCPAGHDLVCRLWSDTGSNDSQCLRCVTI